MGFHRFFGKLMPNRAKPARRGGKDKPESLTERGRRGRIFVFTSGKGGVGKTMVTTSIGFALGKKGKQVLILDLDTGLRNLDVVAGVDEMITHNLYDVMKSGGIHWEDALVQRPGAKNVYILETDQAGGRGAIPVQEFKELVREMARYFDYVLIDCPAGIGSGFSLAVAPADEAVVVTTTENASLRGAAQACTLLERQKISPVTCVLNMVDAELIENKLCADSAAAALRLGVPVIAEIPFERLVRVCGHRGIPLSLWAKESPARNGILSLADLIAGPVTDRIQGFASGEDGGAAAV